MVCYSLHFVKNGVAKQGPDSQKEPDAATTTEKLRNALLRRKLLQDLPMQVYAFDFIQP